MKTKMTLLAVSAFAALTGFSYADCADGQCSTKKCAKEMCDKSKCDKSSCDKGMCKADAGVTHFNVTGMTCEGCSKKLTAALSALNGVEVKKVCHKSGCVDVKLSNGATADQVKAEILKNGFKFAPEKKA